MHLVDVDLRRTSTDLTVFALAIELVLRVEEIDRGGSTRTSDFNCQVRRLSVTDTMQRPFLAVSPFRNGLDRDIMLGMVEHHRRPPVWEDPNKQSSGIPPDEVVVHHPIAQLTGELDQGDQHLER